ncbi:hypothetical protein C7B67_21055 [filamentous cyanobacterium Phorm 6]|nr:hypothetical protein C7B67_21055 [filamentous cyanobacterium Phorm 6]
MALRLVNWQWAVGSGQTIPVLPLRGGVLSEFEKKVGWGGCANHYKFAILSFTAGVTQLVE